MILCIILDYLSMRLLYSIKVHGSGLAGYAAVLNLGIRVALQFMALKSLLAESNHEAQQIVILHACRS